ncbi:diheme cytochrome c [Denitromonas iodatirespirans]|uniref:Diheme cytochrome c n=1 Tax=Denitromonas iodatirespirans TaxID=2795389 RepID=A0A944DA96_DENI1|nr:diheme cytochrome c [Denitromonas iodatirespirans]MBT0962849.1 diheme cytochrome c [Denitromonas iodatirespirans]
MTTVIRSIVVGAVLFAAGAVMLSRAKAGSDEFFPPVTDPLTRQECGGCHMAFPAGLLPARSWQKVMGELDNHFGDDASVDAATARQINTYLMAHAADSAGNGGMHRWLRGVSAAAAPQRITELPKWVREHREVARSDWTRKEVASKANCVACHVDAERGYFEDD